MRFRTVVIYALVAVFLAGVFLNAQGAMEIRAASSSAVAGWQRVTAADGEAMWIAPAASLRSTDIARSELQTLPDGRSHVNVVFTADGARKMQELSRAQTNQRIALMLDGTVVWAPVVRDPIGGEAVVSGLSAADAKRLQSALQRQ
jgi:preprotein translocase subunit SecD